MHLTFGIYVLLGANSLLELVVCAYAFRRRLYLRLPLFTAYLTLLFLRNFVLWWFYLGPGYDSRAAFDYFWVTQGLLLAARGAAIGEIAWRVLHRYRGIWTLGLLVLLITAVSLLAHAGYSALGNRSWIAPFVLTAERGLELAAVGIVVSLFYFSRYYGIRLEPVEGMVALGLGIYSAVQVINISFMREWLTRYFHWWANIRVISFLVALAIWWLALRKPLPAERPAPELLSQEIYDGLAPQVSFRLRKLNETLLELLKS
jgi:hypothetical protein